ncbi:Hypothetical_protein [Hexamita inflata]|uniref:Hypothetical_protein n=1 Tax=Hexamita inflata TaxID=28002 RepID=A0ABP1HHV0_9EUKA
MNQLLDCQRKRLNEFKRFVSIYWKIQVQKAGLAREEAGGHPALQAGADLAVVLSEIPGLTIQSISNRNSLLLLLLGCGLLVVLGVLWLLVLLWLLFLHGNMRGGRDNRIRPDSTQIAVRRRFIAYPNSDWIRQIFRFQNARRGGKQPQRRNEVHRFRTV